MKTLIRGFLLIALVAAIFAGRWLWLYGDASYAPPEVAEIQPDAIVLPTVEYRPFMDMPIAGEGRVLIDMAHDNNLALNDLSPLQARLEARGVEIEFYDGDTALRHMLHPATAMIVLAPSVEFTPEEQKAIAAFVEDGGRLFLAADPTRPVVSEDASEDSSSDESYDYFFPISAVPAINSVANLFGVVYFDDYLYNLADNAGNYRNVILNPGDAKSPLTQDLGTVVFYAAHSLRSTGTALLHGDSATASSVRTGEADLPAAVLANDTQVLAVGDITFLTAPYHAMADNDRFLSHIADWLAEDARARDALDDFPYLFDQPVDLVQLSGDLIDPRLIIQGGVLQTYFEAADLSLTIRTEVVPDHDALLLGVFSDEVALQAILAKTGITVTTEIAGEASPAAPSPSEETPGDETEEELLDIPSMGTVNVKGMTLFSVDCNDERCQVGVIAETAEKVANAVNRLVYDNFEGCAQAGAVTLCSSGEIPEAPPESPETPSKGRILIISVEDGLVGSRTSAEDFAAILEDTYAVTLWTIPDDGEPEADDLEGYDVYIVDFGDYAGGSLTSPAFLTVGAIESGGVLLVGAQPLPVDTLDRDYAPIGDLVVADVEHPLLEGLTAGEIISLLPSESDVPGMILSDEEDPESVSLLLRGPDSPETGSPALIAALDETTAVNRIVVAAFAFYRLPETMQSVLAHNIAAWLMGNEP